MIDYKKKEIVAEERIEQKTRFLNSGESKIVCLPTFMMGGGITGFVYQPDIEVIVSRDQYESLELSGRPIYVSVDSKDKRPFIYWGGPTPLHGDNEKVKLVEIIQPIDESRKIVYIDKNIYNLRLNNLNVELIPLDDKRYKINKKRMGSDFDPLGDILNEDLSAKQEDLPFPKKNGKETPINTLGANQKQKRRIIVNIPPNHKWHGTSKKKNNKWTATCKGKHLGTFDTSLEAAKEYNKHVIKNGLPYTLNNVPGLFDEYSNDINFELSQISIHDLAKEIMNRTKLTIVSD